MTPQQLLETNTQSNSGSEQMMAVQLNAPRGSNSSSSLTLEAVKDTILKSKPLQSDALSSRDKHSIKAGTQLALASFSVEGNHLKINASEALFNQGTIWYVFAEHAEILKGNTKVYPAEDFIKLPVPYKSQMDNNNDPSGTCNVTSIAMCLEYLKIPRQSDEGQFEDELDNYAFERGLDRHVPADLAQIVRDYGAKDRFTETATIDEVKDWLVKGNPAVVHGYFTESGHIIVLVGYDSTGFIVHDPYGEWFSWGYDRNESDGHNQKGKFLHYSYEMIQKTCIIDGTFWVHFISR